MIASPKRVLALIRQNLVDLKATYGDARRTQITDQARGALTVHDVLPEEDVWVTVRSDGTVGRAPERLPAGTAAPLFVLEANTHCDLYLINRRGQATRIGVHQLPDGAGANHFDLGGLKRGDHIAAAFTAQKPNGEPVEGFLVLATAKGAIKRINMADLAAAAQANPNVIKLDDDTLAWAGVSSGGGEIMLVTAAGQVIRFAEDDVRPMGLPAGGIAGIKLQGDDRVVGGAVVTHENTDRELALLTSAGYGRRSPLADFPAKGRGTQGVGAKLATKSGPIVASLLVKPVDKLLVAVSDGAPKPLTAKAIPAAPRTGAGKVVLVLGALQASGAILLPEGGVAPEGPKTNGSGAAEKSKRSTKAEAPKTKAAAAKSEPAPGKTGTAARATCATAAGKPEDAAPAVKAEPAPPKPDIPTAGAKPAGTPVKATAAKSKTAAPAKPSAGAPKPEAPATKAKPAANTKTEAASEPKPAAKGQTESAAAKAKPEAKAQAAAEEPPAASPGPKVTHGKKPGELPIAKAEPDDVVSREGKPGVMARPTPPAGGQMTLLPPDGPAPAGTPQPPKKPPKGK